MPVGPIGGSLRREVEIWYCDPRLKICRPFRISVNALHIYCHTDVSDSQLVLFELVLDKPFSGKTKTHFHTCSVYRRPNFKYGIEKNCFPKTGELNHKYNI
jgi:hypothetical protein